MILDLCPSGMTIKATCVMILSESEVPIVQDYCENFNFIICYSYRNPYMLLISLNEPLAHYPALDLRCKSSAIPMPHTPLILIHVLSIENMLCPECITHWTITTGLFHFHSS